MTEYAFGSKQSDVMEALRVILTHEQIPFSHAVSVDGDTVMFDIEHLPTVRRLLQEWFRAVTSLAKRL